MDLVFANNSLFVTDEHDEWRCMWDLLAQHPINAGLDEPRSAENGDESWPYMSSSIYDAQPKHAFRHRCHPKTQRRENVFVPVSISFETELLKVASQIKDM